MARGYSSRTFDAGRIILFAVEDPQNLYLPGGAILDYDEWNWQGGKVIPAGVAVIRDSSSGLYKPWKGTQANGAGTAATALIVDDASLFSVGDAIHAGSTLTTVDDVDYDTNTITLADAATWTNNSAVGPASGYRAANDIVGFISDEFGVDLEPGGEAQDVAARLLIAGKVKSDMIYNMDAIAASIAAGEQPYVNDFQFWTGNRRVA